MTNATYVINWAQKIGVNLTVDGDRLKVLGEQTGEFYALVEMIKPIKFDVIEALKFSRAAEGWNVVGDIPADLRASDAVSQPRAKEILEEFSELKKVLKNGSEFSELENQTECHEHLDVAETADDFNASWQMLDEELTLDPRTSALTDFAGAIVTDTELDELQWRCINAGLTLHALPSDDKWYVTGADGKANKVGKIVCGAAPDTGHYHYVIKPETPLYQRTADFDSYKRWLWTRMKDDGVVLNEMYTIINGAWVGCDVYVDGPNADGVVAAAGWLLNQYNVDGLPIMTKGKGQPPQAHAVDWQSYVGKIVSDEDMVELYAQAHAEGIKLTSQAMSDTLPCEHRVTGWQK